MRVFLVAALSALALNAATPTAQSHPNRPYWPLAKLNRIAISAIVVVKDRNYLAILLSCKGEGNARMIGGKRAWTHFNCTAPLSRGRATTGSPASGCTSSTTRAASSHPTAASCAETGPGVAIAGPPTRGEHGVMEPPIEHRDVTTIMRLLGDIYYELRRIRALLEDEDGEEEEAAEDHP